MPHHSKNRLRFLVWVAACPVVSRAQTIFGSCWLRGVMPSSRFPRRDGILVSTLIRTPVAPFANTSAGLAWWTVWISSTLLFLGSAAGRRSAWILSSACCWRCVGGLLRQGAIRASASKGAQWACSLAFPVLITAPCFGRRSPITSRPTTSRLC